ncbi:hypothetical protein [Thermospira aquatica]|uniref:Uncharacterized protein n=1 Tax=Thermospira aquatica TaxID=2828656 RepID=A0AAX3BDB3_9SPIR|nr:hypothetical protein [Thermospira aquatica]URA10265.1 hypothetical protein KDW03_00215 [Thermospira aquatica]
MRSLLFILVICVISNGVYSIEIKPFGSNSVYVIDREVELFEQPSANSMKLMQLPYLQCVNILGKTNIIMASNSNVTEWFYIDSGMSSNQEMVLTDNGWKVLTIQGWTERRHLAGKNDFKPVKKIQEMFIEAFDEEGGVVYYRIYSNGTYRIITKNLVYNVDNKSLKGKFINSKI